MNIYLDIDGVILAKDGKPANHANDFLRHILREYPDSTYWLTTHCQGDASVPVAHIGHLLEPDVQELIKQIQPTSWAMVKTQGIDFTTPFLWFDDQLGYADKKALVEHNALDNLILVDLVNDPDQLQQFIHNFPLPITGSSL